MSPKSFPLTRNQLDIWHDQAAYSDSPLYNIGGNLSLYGPVNYHQLNLAVKQLMLENEVLSLTISDSDKSQDIRLSYTQNTDFDLEFHDFSHHDAPERVTKNWLDETFKTPFSFAADALLWHFSLLKESDCKYYLMTKFHHLIADGWSTQIVIARLAELYSAGLEGRSPTPCDTQNYSDYIHQEQRYLASKKYPRDQLFWQQTLPSLPTPLITDIYPAKKSHSLPSANIHRFKLKRQFHQQLTQFAQHHNSTIYHVFIAALSLYFSRVTQRDDIIIGTPSLNRSGAKFKQVIGLFMSLSPLILHIEAKQNINQLLKLCGTALRNTYRHQHFPLSQISQRLELIKNGRNSLFDLIVSYEKQEYSSPYGNTKVSAQQQFSGIARYPLAVTICEFHQHSDIEIILEGTETAFSPQDLQLLSERIIFILQQMAATPKTPLNQIDLLPKAEKQFINTVFNHPNNKHTFAAVTQQFEWQAQQHPHAIAIETNQQKISYQQLSRQSNQLANRLISQGASAPDIIALCLPRCPEMLIAMLASLKTGAAYLPIDPNAPQERITEILRQSQATTLLTTKSLEIRFRQFNHTLLTLDNLPIGAPDTLPSVTINAQNLAYVIFTSGSAGKPKGVMLTHAALSQRIAWIQQNFNIQNTDRVAQTIQYCFDPSLIEIFLALTQGATLVLSPENHQSPDAFAQFIVNKNIHALALVPSSLRNLLQGLKPHQRTSLKVACCGGEVLTPALAEQFQQQTNAELLNVYGPTEAALFATAWRYQRSNQKALPIGQPITNTSIYIFDQHQQPFPIGITGEIVIGGDALATGYLQQPRLTQEKFMPDPYRPLNNSYLYKTGDLGYIGMDKQLYFLGRKDRQVKISGYRIELGEIEALLNSHKDVQHAAAIVIEQKIYAYVETINDYSESLAHSLTQLLHTNLPIYMQVSTIIAIDSMPQSQTGKINYAALPEPNPIETQKNSLPNSVLETQLTKLWQETLKKQPITLDDNFFELGGDSLAAVTLIQKIEKLTGYKHSLSLLLEHPSIKQQAVFLNSELPIKNQPILRTLSENPRTSPPFYLAASGKGDSLRFKNLAGQLENICSLHMLYPTEHHQAPSITKLAAEYAAIILIRNEPPGYIGGFSIGGITALETAHILEKNGQPPLGVLLLDSIYPRWPLNSLHLFKLLNHLINGLHLNKLTVNGRRLNIMLSDSGISIQLKAIQQHTIKPFNGPIGLITSTHIHPKTWLFSKWFTLYGKKLQHYNVSGFHGGMFQEQNLKSLSIAIRQFMKIG